MSRLASLLSTLLLGCSFQGASSSNPQDSDASADPVDAGPIDAASDAPPPDQDEDGVADSVDNCPDTPNSSQANEDGDARGNVCDICPAVDDDGIPHEDADSDGVGDPCDPQEGIPNSLVFFEGFDDPIVVSEWNVTSTWTQDMASGVMNRPANDARAYFLRKDVTGGDDNILVVASVVFRNERLNAPNAYRYGGVVGEASDNADSFQGCWMIRDNADGDEFFAFVRNNGGLASFQEASVDATPDVRYEIAHAVRGTTHNCFVDSSEGVTDFAQTSPSNFGGNDVGVAASFVEATVFYLYAIRLQ